MLLANSLNSHAHFQLCVWTLKNIYSRLKRASQPVHAGRGFSGLSPRKPQVISLRYATRLAGSLEPCQQVQFSNPSQRRRVSGASGACRDGQALLLGSGH